MTLPYYDKLLPENLEVTIQKKKTLVINLTKTLIQTDYRMGHGFEVIKRPGLHRFLQEMGKIYEVVIFGTEDTTFVEEICEKLDHFEMNIRFKLGKEATRLENGKYIKDLRYLNRNLKNVIVVDFDLDNVKYTPYNAVIIPEFTGDVKDRELLNIIPFLKEMSKQNITDVPKELEKYGNFRPQLKFYKSNSKYHSLLPKDNIYKEDENFREAINENKNK